MRSAGNRKKRLTVYKEYLEAIIPTANTAADNDTPAPAAALSSGACVHQEHARERQASQVNVPEGKGHADQQSSTDSPGLLPGASINVS